MTGHLAHSDVRRMARAGMTALSTDEGLTLYDAALADAEPVLVPMRMDTAAVRAQSQDSVPVVLRSLLRVPGRRAVEAGPTPSSGLVPRLAGLVVAERGRAMLDFVRAEVATVLDIPSTEPIEAGRAFKDLGFDSLTAVELRNRITTATGLQLPATLVFDYPNSEVLARWLLAELLPAEESSARSLDEELDSVEQALSLATPDGVTRAKVKVRLQTLLAKWDDPQSEARTDNAADILESGSDEEIFALINEELGRS
ncbi:phosphopantetheine-binding protein [Streptomyces sp. MMG1121]|uniref:phosphopantetheine-binding protein n=1 Tax=Streptomyces sp. MMG1121 TaxID=1415544 RepID=UPI0006AE2BEA